MGPELALIATVVGTATSAIGSIKQGQAANQTAKFNAQVAENAAIGSRQTAAENERRQRRVSLKRQGAMRAQGASLDLLEDNAMEEELQALTIRHGGNLRARGFQQQAALDRMQGKTAVSSSRVGAATTLLKGGVGAADKYEDLPAGSPLRF
tara:strand:- start:4052 stop:4507 length:456 start_codon:yes stop_codon:yes gene_type:complete